MMYDADSYKLCYVDNLYAYFTNGDPFKMWGYGWAIQDSKIVKSPPKEWTEDCKLEQYNIYKVHYGSGLFKFNEDKAINYINEKKLPFLKRYFSEDYIHSGCSLMDFIKFCNEHRVDIYLQYPIILDF